MTRPVEVEERDGRVAREPGRFVVEYSNQLVQHQAQLYRTAQSQKADEWEPPSAQAEVQRFAWVAAAEAACAA